MTRSRGRNCRTRSSWRFYAHPGRVFATLSYARATILADPDASSLRRAARRPAPCGQAGTSAAARDGVEPRRARRSVGDGRRAGRRLCSAGDRRLTSFEAYVEASRAVVALFERPRRSSRRSSRGVSSRVRGLQEIAAAAGDRDAPAAAFASSRLPITVGIARRSCSRRSRAPSPSPTGCSSSRRRTRSRSCTRCPSSGCGASAR